MCSSGVELVMRLLRSCLLNPWCFFLFSLIHVTAIDGVNQSGYWKLRLLRPPPISMKRQRMVRSIIMVILLRRVMRKILISLSFLDEMWWWWLLGCLFTFSRSERACMQYTHPTIRQSIDWPHCVTNREIRKGGIANQYIVGEFIIHIYMKS